MADNAEVYKITVVDDMGNELVSYVKPEARTLFIRQMTSEYGNAKVEPMMLADLPEGVLPPKE